MAEDHLPDLTPEQMMELGEVDLAIAEILISLDESLADLGLEEVDRTLIIHHVRWAYIEGWTQRNNAEAE